MRIWSKKLIPFLPQKQLLAMRYELGDMIKQYPNIKHGLVKFANNYAPTFLLHYFGAVCSECERRGLNCTESYNESVYQIAIEKSNKYDVVSDNYTFKEDNDEYLQICLINLYEKYLRETIPEDEWKPIYNNFKEYLD